MTTIYKVRPLDMKRPENIRDRALDPDVLDCRPLAGLEAPRDLTRDERAVLLALGEHASAIAALAVRLERDSVALAPTIRRLEDRGLLTRFGPYGSALRLTTPTGRALARALAVNNPARSAANNTKE